MREACARLGNPERKFPVLHVAGTNGKGSTCAFTESALRAAGLRTGLYTSPHLWHFCERIRIGGAPISEERACSLLEALGPLGELTFFEIVTLMAFVAFAEAKVDVAVIEVGLGGRLDATNVIDAPLACAITALGLEHTEYLGPTLTDIAREKAGILKPGAPAVSAGQPLEAARVLGDRVRRPGRDYVFESRDGHPFCYRGPRWTLRPERLGLRGHHQRANAAVAAALLETTSLVSPEHVERGLATARWPGRLEQIASAPEVLVDGAHNPHAVRALVRSLAGERVHLVFGALQDKDAAQMLAALQPIAASVRTCAPDSPRARDPRALAAICGGTAYGSPREALEAARAAAGPNGTVLVCGSLYLVGELRAEVLGLPAGRMPAEQL
jgi:dihydrofolate synthase/folylpolyglutamate synthase